MTLEKTVARLTAQDDEIGYRWVCAHCLQRRLYTKAQANAHVRTT